MKSLTKDKQRQTLSARPYVTTAHEVPGEHNSASVSIELSIEIEMGLDSERNQILL